MTFDDINYLIHGTPRQREAYHILNETRILEVLHAYTPILAGTIPLAIDTSESDLDIICCWTTKQQFHECLVQSFGNYRNFKIKEKLVRGERTVIATFHVSTFQFEIFGQNTPVIEQYAYRHLIAEYNILQHFGDDLRAKVIALKRQGVKTEPAFAQVLGLKGDPYDALLAYTIPV